ncbi:hypothetical protein M427DRAFT_433932 [Gonapodya prolifera JEL478]|uniref:Glutathione S-transferase C-terminal domain-containing protein n=1 Tax=Gonapodya prolifera (strain JEL478) TaxID=1344416 RepID=A0A139ATA0_GONPJ|nr:hypothetical protein M427DRAFT_433932 [Gonapodya prolifera JEL478]|eukprot:KXS19957.1 hypothetical protein M427DRAFT_433932 [Gonapodya prolifera JEL478]
MITGTLAIASFLLSNVGANSMTVRTGGAAMHNSLQKLEKYLSKRSYVVGNNLSLADIAMYTSLSSIAGTLSPDTTPSVIRFFDTIQHRLRLPYRFGAKARTARTVEPVLCANPPLPLVIFKGTQLESNSKPTTSICNPAEEQISRSSTEYISRAEAEQGHRKIELECPQHSFLLNHPQEESSYAISHGQDL